MWHRFLAVHDVLLSLGMESVCIPQPPLNCHSQWGWELMSYLPLIGTDPISFPDVLFHPLFTLLIEL